MYLNAYHYGVYYLLSLLDFKVQQVCSLQFPITHMQAFKHLPYAPGLATEVSNRGAAKRWCTTTLCLIAAAVTYRLEVDVTVRLLPPICIHVLDDFVELCDTYSLLSDAAYCSNCDSNHTCTAPNTCVCLPGWTGSDCSEGVYKYIMFYTYVYTSFWVCNVIQVKGVHNIKCSDSTCRGYY